jgi:hypothetical protein|tara:strand:+ start:105 stop:380 length:276 start_codon:yes stop_codon:yes gene_type:complete
MSEVYAYQIQGILEKPNKDIGGIRVVVYSFDQFRVVDVPSTVLDSEVKAYLKFRLAANNYVDVSKLPHKMISKIRNPLNAWLDDWVLYGEA